MIKRVIITSGPTVEPIDPVRFISNRSSGKTGMYLAEEALRREVQEIIFITGPACYLPTNSGITIEKIETAEEMRHRIFNYFDDADAVIMAAAVSDYRVLKYHDQKIKKNQDSLTLEFIKNSDILSEMGRNKKKQILVGYAAETHNILDNARKKYENKNLDLLVLNQISQDNPAFATDQNQVYLINQKGITKLDKMEKSEIARHVWDEVFRLKYSKKLANY